MLCVESIKAETTIAAVDIRPVGLVQNAFERDGCRTQDPRSYCYGLHGLIPRRTELGLANSPHLITVNRRFNAEIFSHQASAQNSHILIAAGIAQNCEPVAFISD